MIDRHREHIYRKHTRQLSRSNNDLQRSCDIQRKVIGSTQGLDVINGAIHTSELDRSEIDLSPKRSECERSNSN